MGMERRVTAVLACLVLGGGLSAAGAPGGGRGEVPAVPLDAPVAHGPDASTGRVVADCGRNGERHYNEDNLVVSPGVRAGAHHTHAYVGNLSTTAASTDASLAAAATSCRDGDRSTYYWPVLRRTDLPGREAYERAAGHHGNAGRILREAAVTVEFRGNPVSKVVAMPRFLRGITGDAVAHTAADASRVRAAWGCAGLPGLATVRYPRCPGGDRITRTLVFPSCWNGLDTAAPDHRAHLTFPAGNGACAPGTFPVPALRLSLVYEPVPPGTPLALDSFPEQQHSPRTDHAMFVNVMDPAAMERVVDCINSGRSCRGSRDSSGSG
ncbi:DUF1996 domain-containing protein [Streptomyces sp. NPDC101118]|uniref:DUF1996 domain-containing protein n=1 Tax=Streptomyces sp. NPDC101118 TaxID=3366109 RepID=UPI0037F68B8C